MILKTLLEKNYMEKWNIKTKPSCWFKRFKFVLIVFANVCSDSSLVLEITWKQARNESFKVHEMEQLY
jgi:hypothetical protein